jgi:Domain of unknown function (DUF1772)
MSMNRSAAPFGHGDDADDQCRRLQSMIWRCVFSCPGGVRAGDDHGARWPGPDAPWALAGGAIFLIGTLSVTALCNVPRNDALEAMPADAQGAAELWSGYLREWTFWNHVRSGSALVAAALLTFALIKA